jgi:hypothetical protein
MFVRGENKTKTRVLGGNLMHFSWYYGCFFFLVYIVVCVFEIYLLGVTVETGYCQPLSAIEKDSKFVNKIWSSSEN